jgi:ABC-type multidrug transport system ATPase subunit
MSVVLVADCVTKSFRQRRVLSSASLRAVSGQLRVMFGRNGEGKSTLIKIAAGCLAADSGSVHFDGSAYLSPRLRQLAARGLFYLPDHDLFSTAFTVRRQLEMIRLQFDGGSVEAAAERMGVGDHIDRLPYKLSGGELRRAELAAIIVRRPRCVLADEPFRGIAPADAEQLAHAFRELASAGVAVVVTGHEVPTLLEAADHITWCTSGTTYELGPPSVAVRDEAFQRGYLGPHLHSPAR